MLLMLLLLLLLLSDGVVPLSGRSRTVFVFVIGSLDRCDDDVDDLNRNDDVLKAVFS